MTEPCGCRVRLVHSRHQRIFVPTVEFCPLYAAASDLLKWVKEADLGAWEMDPDKAKLQEASREALIARAEGKE